MIISLARLVHVAVATPTALALLLGLLGSRSRSVTLTSRVAASLLVRRGGDTDEPLAVPVAG